MVPLLVEQVRDRRNEADVQVTTDVRSAYAGRTQSVRRTGCPTHTRLVFPFNSGCLVDFLEYLAGLAVWSVSRDSRLVRESPPVSIHVQADQAETSSNVPDWRVGAKFSLSFQVHHYELQLVRNRLVPPPVWASLLPEVPGLRFVLLYLSGGPRADALGHTGSLPGFAQQGLLFPEGGKVVV